MFDPNWFIVMVNIGFNFTDFIDGGMLRWGIVPYYVIFGNFTWGIILGFIGTGLYANERSLGTVMLYLLLVGIFFAIVLPFSFVFLLGLIFTFLISVVLYKGFIEKTS